MALLSLSLSGICAQEEGNDTPSVQVTPIKAKPGDAEPAEGKKKFRLNQLFGGPKDKNDDSVKLPPLPPIPEANLPMPVEVAAVDREDSPPVEEEPLAEVNRISLKQKTNQAKSGELRTLPPEIFPRSGFPEVRKDTLLDGEVKKVVGSLSKKLVEKIEGFDEPELFAREGEDVPPVFQASWEGAVTDSIWEDQKEVETSLAETYRLSLEHSLQVRALSRLPLIFETSARETLVDYSAEFFANGDLDHTDEPTGSTLTTGRTGRFIEDSRSGDYGLRKRFFNGAEVQLSNRLTTLKNNSDFLDPNPQTGSELVLSLLQPMLRGGGKDYQLSTFRIAKLESEVAAVTFLRQLQDHLVEVNRAYWGVYLARAAYVQRLSLTEKTRQIVEKLEARSKLDAAAAYSELFRARSSLKKREADIQRAKMAVRIAEVRLRSLVNAPDLQLGKSGEFIPSDAPAIEAPPFNIRPIALAAMANRSELIQAVLGVQAAAVNCKRAGNELLPQLDLVTEVGYAGIGSGRRLGDAFSDSTRHGTEVRTGFRFSHQLERDLVRNKVHKRKLEFLQKVDELNLLADQVLVDTLIAYREMVAAYRDMRAKSETLRAAKEEVRDLENRVDLDADAENQTIGYFLRLQLNALERQQVAEEEFLVSVVAYNTALTALERVQGTFLQYEDVSILRDDAKGPGNMNLKASAPGR